MSPQLEAIARQLNYDDLPETWRVPQAGRFSAGKTLYDYQTDALQKAAQALYLYYGAKGRDQWRKMEFCNRYDRNNSSCLAVPQYESKHARKNGKENPIFRILSEYFQADGESIPSHEFINRMSFWMATGSGKTLVMVKLIQHLHALMAHKNIPTHNILLLAPKDYLLAQIRRTVEEFNEAGIGGLHIDLVPLRDWHIPRREAMGRKTLTVYYHRSDNISDVQKDAVTNYRIYANDGKWYILLDEAHKGGKENSKRQAYYAVMARRGFLFNFSATFTDAADIVTTVKKYNLENFVKNGYGKNICINTDEYRTFRDRGGEANHDERKRIVLKSLLTFAHTSACAEELREKTGLGDALYHRPLMLTLVNSVNTDTDRNDLWAFFQTLRELAANEISKDAFAAAKDELADAWKSTELMFGEQQKLDAAAIRKITPAALRRAVFRSDRKGSLQCVHGKDKKELAFQLKNADSPFALIRIGDTTKWRNELLQGYEVSGTLRKTSFFDNLSSEESKITILMGSRSFFESWDSNRPNVINYINIGGQEAKKFVVQSVGRGVRIQTLRGVDGRRRLSHLSDKGENHAAKQRLLPYQDAVHPVETLFLFATNRKAVGHVLDGLDQEKQENQDALRLLEGFERAPLLKINGKDMPLLVPQYAKKTGGKRPARFAMNKETAKRFQQWLDSTSDSVLMVRDGLSAEEIKDLRDMPQKIKDDESKAYASLPFLQERLLAYLAAGVKVADGMRALKGESDIVHFRNIRVEAAYAQDLEKKISLVKEGDISIDELDKLVKLLRENKITRKEYNRKTARRDEIESSDGALTIKRLENHYYLPVITAEKKADYIQHIIKVPSEVEFLRALEKHLNAETQWDAWMFSKLDESLDEIDIPYYDGNRNEYRRFIPDFIFWLCNSKEKKYQIVFVDPKGTEHTQAFGKIDGYESLFREGKTARLRTFQHKGWEVSVRLLYFNKNKPTAEKYGDYWTSDPAEIFCRG